MAIHSGFTHRIWPFSIAMLNDRRVCFGLHVMARALNFRVELLKEAIPKTPRPGAKSRCPSDRPRPRSRCNRSRPMGKDVTQLVSGIFTNRSGISWNIHIDIEYECWSPTTCLVLQTVQSWVFVDLKDWLCLCPNKQQIAKTKDQTDQTSTLSTQNRNVQKIYTVHHQHHDSLHHLYHNQCTFYIIHESYSYIIIIDHLSSICWSCRSNHNHVDHGLYNVYKYIAYVYYTWCIIV